MTKCACVAVTGILKPEPEMMKRDLSDPPPTYDQTQDKNLPSYDEVTIQSIFLSIEGVTNFGATSESKAKRLT
jgi:hypothetical protein